MRLQIGRGVPLVVIWLFAAFSRRSLAAAMHRRRFFSKFLVAVMVVAHHADLLLAAVSSSFGSMPAHLRLALRLSLYLFLGRPGLRFPSVNSPLKSWRGILNSSIWITWPVQHSWALIIASMLVALALSRTSWFETRSCQHGVVGRLLPSTSLGGHLGQVSVHP